jgi:hypothetical protein
MAYKTAYYTKPWIIQTRIWLYTVTICVKISMVGAEKKINFHVEGNKDMTSIFIMF